MTESGHRSDVEPTDTDCYRCDDFMPHPVTILGSTRAGHALALQDNERVKICQGCLANVASEVVENPDPQTVQVSRSDSQTREDAQKEKATSSEAQHTWNQYS